MYSKRIDSLIRNHPLNIDTSMEIKGRVPSVASSEFLINKEQGDWAEQLVISAINTASNDYVALPYGHSESISAGDEKFAEYYLHYQNELNNIGKRPDILIFRRGEAPEKGFDDGADDSVVFRAVAALEVRSSSFVSKKYIQTMNQRRQKITKQSLILRDKILQEPYHSLLKKKNLDLACMLENANATNIGSLEFRAVSWSSSIELHTISEYLKQLKNRISILRKRDFLSITPKVEDLALVNRWIQRFQIPHYYLQVFFDCGYIIPFEKILEISSNPNLEGVAFTIEKDVKNQNKTTIKININRAQPIIRDIEMPTHISVLKELDKGRLMFYIKFQGGKGSLDLDVFNSIIQ